MAGRVSAGAESGPSLTERLADYWAGARVEDLPAPVVAMCKRVLLDMLLVGMRGATSEEALATLKGVRASIGNAGGESRLWGMKDKLPPAAAALVNGTAGHALEFDDFGGCGHSGAVVIPAVCAIADEIGADGKAVLRAVAAGYDVAGRVTDGVGGYRPHNDRGWHSTGTCGTFGAAAGAAAVLGLDAKRFMWALGIAGSHAAGTWAFLGDGAMTKRIHTGRAAENGVMSAYLAQSGVSGPKHILEAKWGGFYSTYCGPEAVPELTVDKLGENFRVMGSGIKLYPCCRGIHSSIEALLTIMDEAKVESDAIEKIVVHGADRTVRQFAKRELETVLDGQFSMPYALAVVAADGEATLEQFIPLKSGNDQVRALMARVEVAADRKLAAYDEPDLEVRLKSGQVLTKHVPISKGAAARPPTEDDMLRKHKAVAVPVMGQKRFEHLRETINNLEQVKDFRMISDCLKA
jgi:2-methylcitrate dehydratase PrpD